jgi:hypothetical protein
VQFAERPGGRKNVERLDFLKFSPVASVKGEARAKKERGHFCPLVFYNRVWLS